MENDGMRLVFTKLDDVLRDYDKLKFDSQYVGIYFVLGPNRSRRFRKLLPTRCHIPTENE